MNARNGRVYGTDDGSRKIGGMKIERKKTNAAVNPIRRTA
jgi:hypothetical protein